MMVSVGVDWIIGASFPTSAYPLLTGARPAEVRFERVVVLFATAIPIS